MRHTISLLSRDVRLDKIWDSVDQTVGKNTPRTLTWFSTPHLRKTLRSQISMKAFHLQKNIFRFWLRCCSYRRWRRSHQWSLFWRLEYEVTIIRQKYYVWLRLQKSILHKRSLKKLFEVDIMWASLRYLRRSQHKEFYQSATSTACSTQEEPTVLVKFNIYIEKE